jgi:hypothetical protein
MERNNLEFIQRLLEIYSMEELLEFDDLPVDEALEYLVQYGALSFDNVPV